MQTIPLGNSGLRTSVLAYGCWRLAGTWNPAEITPDRDAAGRRAVHAAADAGYTFFDNAAIYCLGECERILGEALREAPGLRDRVLIATKCGIRRGGDPDPGSPHRYDFTAEHIVGSCEASLRRLGVETVDLFMLHRPDFLADPDEVAGAFCQLRQAGKVRSFGVSNQRPSLLAALQAACPLPLVAHQVEISLARLDAFSDGTLDQCLTQRMTPLAWSPLAAGLLGDGAKRLLPAQEGYRLDPVLPVLEEFAAARGVSRTVIALAWLRKHPSGIVPIVGTTNPARIHEAARAAELELTRDEWYRLFVAARGEPLP